MRFHLAQWSGRIWSWWVDRPYPVGKMLHRRYRIERWLGMGSYGISYLCRDLSDGKPCVVKQVKPSRKRTEKGKLAFMHETAILQSLDHSAIPKFYGLFEEHGNLFFSMEYMSGKNLEQLIFDDLIPFSERTSLQLINQLMEIVRYLHSRHVVHRDIRIPNVILDGNQLKLIDFGLARLIGSDLAESNVSEYFIEKQLRREVHVKSDFYSLGHLLLFLLYSTYDPGNEAEAGGTWETELRLHPLTRKLLRRMLQIDEPYLHAEELLTDLHAVLAAMEDEQRAVDWV